MRKVIVEEFITLDGVIQAPGDVDEDTEGSKTGGVSHNSSVTESIGASAVMDKDTLPEGE